MSMTPLDIGLYIMLGGVIGLFAALLGVGGGWLLTPTLNIMGFPAALAVGTSLTQMVGTSLLGVFRHRGKGKVHLAIALLVCVPFIGGVQLGLTALGLLTKANVATLFIRLGHLTLTLFLGLSMFWETRRAKQFATVEDKEPRAPKTWGFTLTVGGHTFPLWAPLAGGLLAGFLSGVLGIGGGIVLVPLMTYVMRIPMVEAVATNLLCIAIGSAAGAVTYGINGNVSFLHAALIIAGSYTGTWVGTNLAHQCEPIFVRRIFSLLMLLMSCALIITLTGHAAIAQILIFSGAFVLAALAVLNSRSRPPLSS